MTQANNKSYQIVLPQFEGPFDLLLFFIERDELDIYDIPIATITDDFLAYVRKMEDLNVDLASEFILVAATLMRIKAKMLIPRKPLDEEGNEIDPREELVQRLLQYKKYKSILKDMRVLEVRRSNIHPRNNTVSELKKIAETALVDVELEDVTLFKLLKTFEKILIRQEGRKAQAIHKVFTYPYTIQEQQHFVLSKLQLHNRLDFQDIFNECKNRVHAIVTFLALLELLNLQKISCLTGDGINNFFLERTN